MSKRNNQIRKINNASNQLKRDANTTYSAYIKRVAQQEQREKVTARKAEIAKLKRESSISAILAQI